MNLLLILLYQCFAVPFMWIATYLGQFLHPKMKLRAQGIVNSQRVLRKSVGPHEHWAWFHAASYGEFEQLRSVIAAVKTNSPTTKVCVSFTSPSGYERLHNTADADLYVYIPVDSPRAANRFLGTLNPKLAIFSRYDLWFNHLRWCSENGVATMLTSATLPDDLQNKRLARNWKRICVDLVDDVFTAGPREQQKFSQLKSSATLHLSADPRVDRIIERVDEANARGTYRHLFPIDDTFSHNIVIGSSWPAEERLAAELALDDAYSSIRWIIVPHEPTTNHIHEVQQLFPSCSLLSEYEANQVDISNTNVVVVDSVGKLLDLYSCASAVVIGGGFGKGVHSVLEPAGYNVPLACGPAIERARDAENLRDAGALTVVDSAQDLTQWVDNQVLDAPSAQKASKACELYMKEQSGATEHISSHIGKILNS